MVYRPRVGLLTAWGSRANGGVFEAVVAHAHVLSLAGFDPHVFALHDEYVAADLERFGDIPVRTFNVFGPRMFGYAPALYPALKAAKLDLLHLHGIWMYPSVAGARWASDTRRPYVISPHGMLDPWITNRSPLKKLLATKSYESKGWRMANAFHALTSIEAGDIVRYTGAREVNVVPNAVQLIGSGFGVASNAPPILVYIGRIHQKKNVEALVEAWRLADISGISPGARLVIAGWGDRADIASLSACIDASDLSQSVSFIGPIFGERKIELLHRARFVALPSLSEGLPLAILEAWAAGIPTLMSQNCNLPEGFVRNAAIDCGTTPGKIAEVLRIAMTMPNDQWRAMSHAAKTYASDEFSFEASARRWAEIYGVLLSSGRGVVS